MFETLSSGVVDAFPAKLSRKKTLVTAALSAAMFLIGLPFTTNVSITMLILRGLQRESKQLRYKISLSFKIMCHNI